LSVDTVWPYHICGGEIEDSGVNLVLWETDTREFGLTVGSYYEGLGVRSTA
jgi:hypothetical protein